MKQNELDVLKLCSLGYTEYVIQQLNGDVKYFTEKQLQLFAKFIFSYYDKYKCFPTEKISSEYWKKKGNLDNELSFDHIFQLLVGCVVDVLNRAYYVAQLKNTRGAAVAFDHIKKYVIPALDSGIPSKISAALQDAQVSVLRHGEVAYQQLPVMVEEMRRRTAAQQAAWEIFPKFSGAYYYDNVLIMLASPTGQGKSTLVTETTLHAMSQGKKVLLLLNEENSSEMLGRLKKRNVGLLRSALKDKKLEFIDHISSNGETCTPEGVVKIISLHRDAFDLIVLDQISYVDTGIHPFPKQDIDATVHGLMKLINDGRRTCPILFTQQCHPCPKDKYGALKLQQWDGEFLSDSRKTLQRCTHGMFYAHDYLNKCGVLLVLKVRIDHLGSTRSLWDVLFENNKLVVCDRAARAYQQIVSGFGVDKQCKEEV